MKNLTKQQKVQEEEYSFPYHYLDLVLEKHKLIFIEHLSILKLVKGLIKPIHRPLILDAGCGDGRLCYELKKDGFQVIGIDFSNRALNFARAFNPGVRFFFGDLNNLRLQYKFDYAVLIETLEHINPKTIQKTLESLSNILNKRGKLIISVPSTNVPLSKKHYQHFTNESLKSILGKYFDVEKIIGYSKGGLKRRLFDWLLIGVVGVCPNFLISGISSFLEGYYERNFSKGKPQKCRGLIAVCTKKERN